MPKDDIIFPFDDFLKKNEQDLPQGLDPQYLKYVEVLQDPFHHLRQLSKAFRTLPMKAFLHQDFMTIIKLASVINLLGIPYYFIIAQSSIIHNKANIGFLMILLTILGIYVSCIYFKAVFGMLDGLVESKKAPWLVEPIQKPFNDSYNKEWNRKILRYSSYLALIPDLYLIRSVLFTSTWGLRFNPLIMILWLVLLIIGHVGLTIMIYITFLCYRYVRFNTHLYDLLLQKIIARVKGYSEGQESILSQKNYEVMAVLSDTPGLSVRSLGDIPTLGLASSVFSVSSLIFLIVGPFLFAGLGSRILAKFPTIYGRGIDSSTGLAPVLDGTGLTYFLLICLFIAMVASIGLVIMPIWRVYRAMDRFKVKALKELDPFLFDEITSAALDRESSISNETQVIYMIRSFVYSMKTSPINPWRTLQLAVLVILYFYRGVPMMVRLITLLSKYI